MYFIIIIVCLIHSILTNFAVIGDWGGHLGSDAQRRVAAVMEQHDPDFVISTDNFYPDGIEHAKITRFPIYGQTYIMSLNEFGIQ